MYSSYIKVPQLKSILENESEPCEKKLDSIKGLIDGKSASSSPPLAEPASDELIADSALNADNTSAESAPPSEISANYDKILANIKGVTEKKTCPCHSRLHRKIIIPYF